MDNCIFCKIVKGDLSSFKVYEDDLFFGFLDIKPLSKGNSLLIPKIHYRWVTDVPAFGAYWQAAKKIALAAQKVVRADYTSFLTLGMEVPHAHIRIIPRFFEDHHQEGINTREVVPLPQEEMSRISAKILSLTTG